MNNENKKSPGGAGSGDALISKKDLLSEFGISYGALYRWKRMGLIPEEWFIKKSVSTGQETFFPRELICERIEKIIGMKESASLDEMKAVFDMPSDMKTPMLVIESAYGVNKYDINKLKSIKLSDGSRETEIIGLVSELFYGKTNGNK
ncbi:hypothetical protein SDC9_93968 [bioreactor metagenome]|uniref:Uncharacterized protein n=1 Tax=bioreactor metagenome TaxID=1076179 RepID=A0A645A229_9ZZZZ